MRMPNSSAARTRSRGASSSRQAPLSDAHEDGQEDDIAKGVGEEPDAEILDVRIARHRPVSQPPLWRWKQLAQRYRRSVGSSPTDQRSSNSRLRLRQRIRPGAGDRTADIGEQIDDLRCRTVAVDEQHAGCGRRLQSRSTTGQSRVGEEMSAQANTGAGDPDRRGVRPKRTSAMIDLHRREH